METSMIGSQKQPSKGGWKSAIFIIFVEMGERFAYYGVSGNLITYLTNVMGESTAVAAKNVNTWHGVAAVFPLLGAFLADSYLGRFRTIVLSSIVYLMGLVILTASVSAIPLEHRRAVFFVALYILTIGEGGHKPCVQTFAADQFDEEVFEERQAKSSFFNWWYLGIVFAATSATLVVIYVQDYVGWAIGFGMLAVAVAVALAVFLIGGRTYRREAPIGSPFTRVAQVFVAAARKWRVSPGADDRRDVSYDNNGTIDTEGQAKVRTLARTTHFRFLEKATIMDETDATSETRNYWRLCTVNQVEDVKLLLHLVPLWLSCLMFAVVIAQLSTFFTKQGSTMITSIGSFHVPPASLQVTTGLTILIAVPVYDRLLVPIARKNLGHPSGITTLQRMGVGILFSILTMVVAALVERKRLSVAKVYGLLDRPKLTVPMKVWWLLPQYMLCGLSDVFTIVGMQELFYDQMPEGMRSLGAAVYLSIVGVGSFLSSGVISVVQVISLRWGGHEWLSGENLNRAHLDYFYWVLAGLSCLSLCFYVWVAKGFVYKKVDWNDDGKELKGMTTQTEIDKNMHV